MRSFVVRLFLLAILAITCATRGALAQDLQSAENVARGHYLAILGDCAACHSAPGGKPFAGGLPIETPFGTIVSANITPDRATGIGAWSGEQFIRAMQEGIAPGGRHLYPAMPYPSFTRVTRTDLEDLRAYLATLAPVHNAVQTDQLPFPFSIRAGMAVWNRLNFTPGEFQADPTKSAAWNRGAYLVEGLGHCGTCHTPKNALGGDVRGRAFAGAVLQGWYAPPLNDDPRTGLGSWSVNDIVAYLGTGWGGGQVAAGPMALVVADSTSHMTSGDLRAIAVYLKSIKAPERAAPTPLAADDSTMRAGLALYTVSCSACHGSDGKGEARLVPALAGSATVQAADPVTLISVVLNGGHAVATDAAPTASGMPAFGWQLSDREIGAVLTYIRNSWGNAASAVVAGTVGTARSRTPAAD